MKSFMLNWQDPDDRRWYSVARLIREKGFFFFAYTRGARGSPRFVPFGNMSRLDAVYVSERLFPIFANRVMNERRPDFLKYTSWSALDSEAERDPLLLMARMGGGRVTDTLQVYPVPERDARGMYHTIFFCHGISHLPDHSQVRCEEVTPGEPIFPMLDFQNPYDTNAVALRSGDPVTFLGYCPRYLAKDISFLGREAYNALSIVVKRVNCDAPPQYRLLCEVTSRWPNGFAPCEDEEQKLIIDFSPESIIEDMSGHADLASL